MVCEKACDLQPRLERPFGWCPEEWHESINAHWTGCPSLPSRLGRGSVWPVRSITHCSNFTKLYLVTTATAAFSSPQRLKKSLKSLNRQHSMLTIGQWWNQFFRCFCGSCFCWDMIYLFKSSECFSKVCPALLYSSSPTLVHRPTSAYQYLRRDCWVIIGQPLHGLPAVLLHLLIPQSLVITFAVATIYFILMYWSRHPLGTLGLFT